MIFKHTIICNNINNLIKKISDNNFISDFNYYLHNKYIIGISISSSNYFFIRIWKSRVFYNKIITNFDVNKNMFCCFDFIVYEKIIKIIYFYINEKNKHYNKVKKILMDYIENISNNHIIIHDYNKNKLSYIHKEFYLY